MVSHVEYTVSKLCVTGISTPGFCPDQTFAPVKLVKLLLCEHVDTKHHLCLT